MPQDEAIPTILSSEESRLMDYPSEIFDQVQLLFDVNRFNDHQLHCVLRFESGPDAALLKQAVICSIEAFPILGSRYADGPRPHWTSLAPDRFGAAFVAVRTEAEFEAFIVSRIDESRGPQVKVCLLEASPSAVALTLNHMVCDASGFKTYLYFLCQIYAELEADLVWRPTKISGDRSLRGVLTRFGPMTKLKSLISQRKDNNRYGKHRFPLSEGGDVRPFILTRKLGRARVGALKDYARQRGATLNDLMLTSYYRCLFRRLALSSGVELQVPIMVDMRRYLGDTGGSTSLTNLTSMVNTRLAYKPGERFKDTITRVKAILDEKKGSDIGLNAFIKLDLLYRLLGDRIANRRLRAGLKNPLICMTNLGILDAKRLSFGDSRPHDAFMCGSIKYKPYFQLALSTYEDEITLSINQYGSADDRDRILLFFDEIDADLPYLAVGVRGRLERA
jgi:NRPS condensation-like uncharacterized protein